MNFKTYLQTLYILLLNQASGAHWASRYQVLSSCSAAQVLRQNSTHHVARKAQSA